MVDILEEYTPIILMLKKCKKIQGRKRFQKLLYLTKSAGISIDETFEWNNYGPFSKELAQEIDALCRLDIIHEDFNGLEYVYTLTENGIKILKHMPKEYLNKYENLESIIEKLNQLTTKELEKLASIKFLINEGYPKNYIFPFLKHSKHYSDKEIDMGIKELGKLI